MKPVALAALAACGCAAPPPVADAQPVGVETDVRVLDAGFVDIEGRRMALEWFLMDMRERARAAAGDPARLPRLVIRIPSTARGVDARWLDNLRTELHKAGIRHVQLGGA